MTLRLGYSRLLGPLHPHPTLRFGKEAGLELHNAGGASSQLGRRSGLLHQDEEEAFQTCKVVSHSQWTQMRKLKLREEEFQSPGRADPICGMPRKIFNNNNVIITLLMFKHQTTSKPCSLLSVALHPHDGQASKAVLGFSTPFQQKGKQIQ